MLRTQGYRSVSSELTEKGDRPGAVEPEGSDAVRQFRKAPGPWQGGRMGREWQGDEGRPGSTEEDQGESSAPCLGSCRVSSCLWLRGGVGQGVSGRGSSARQGSWETSLRVMLELGGGLLSV